MKLSEFSLSVLKNFSNLNSSLLLKKGKIQRTMKIDKAVLVEAEIDDIPIDFGIYDLNQFLGNITTFGNPELTFDGEVLQMEDSVMKMSYKACPANLIPTPATGNLNIKEDVKFTLNNSILQKLIKFASMNSFFNLTMKHTNGELLVIAHDFGNDGSNKVSANLGPTESDNPDFEISFKTENFKLIPDDYDVVVQIGGYARFTSKTKKIKYYIAADTVK